MAGRWCPLAPRGAAFQETSRWAGKEAQEPRPRPPSHFLSPRLFAEEEMKAQRGVRPAWVSAWGTALGLLGMHAGYTPVAYPAAPADCLALHPAPSSCSASPVWHLPWAKPR